MTAKHKLAVAAAGAVVLAGAGTALAAGAGGHHPGSGFEQGRDTQTHPGFGAPGLRGPRGFGLGFGVGRLGLGGGLLRAASDYLGVPVATLVGDLRSGQSLADVAGKTSGKSAADLITALVAHQRAQLDRAVAAGKLTQAQADRVTANLQQRITALVNAKPPTGAFPRTHGRGYGFPGFGRGRHGGWATPPATGETA